MRVNDKCQLSILKIKKLTINDVEILRKSGNLFWKNVGIDEELKNFLSDKNNWAYVACYEGDIAGFAFGYILDTFYSKPMCYIHSIDVAEEYRRKGFGKTLMNKIIDDCKDNGIKECFLITNKSNVSAVKLYESVGGRLLNDDDIVYEWNFEEK